jgi:hypothetical protein
MELWGDENNTLLQVDHGKAHMILCQEQSILDHQQKMPHYSSLSANTLRCSTQNPF